MYKMVYSIEMSEVTFPNVNWSKRTLPVDNNGNRQSQDEDTQQRAEAADYLPCQNNCDTPSNGRKGGGVPLCH
jgi:hypothetical protein